MPEHDGSELYLIAEGLDNQMKALRQHGQAQLDSLKVLIDARLHERDRLMDERFHDRDLAIEVASEEREKSAQALRVELARAMSEGDDRLREHIENQIRQIREALASADRLELARMRSLEEKAEAIQREISLTQNAAGTAIEKAEDSVNKRLEAMNEFRAQLDRQAATFTTHQELDAATERLSSLIERNRIDIGERQTKESFEGTLRGWVLWRENTDKAINQLITVAATKRDFTEDRRAGTSNVLAIVGAVAAALFILLGVLNYVNNDPATPIVVTPNTHTTTTP